MTKDKTWDDTVWVIRTDGDQKLTRVVTDEAKAQKARDEGHEVGEYVLPQIDPEPTAALHSVSIKAATVSPFSATVEIDGKHATNIQAIKVEMGLDHCNRVTMTFEPEQLEIEGQFEGWVRVPSQGVQI